MPFATACNVPGKSDGAPIDRDNTSTPSWMASSMAFMIPAPLHPASIGYEPQQALYTASLARGAPPRATPGASPWKLTLCTMLPAAVEAVWVPWPLASLGDRNSPSSTFRSTSSAYHRAPMSFLLQLFRPNEAPVWQKKTQFGKFPSILEEGDHKNLQKSLEIQAKYLKNALHNSEGQINIMLLKFCMLILTQTLFGFTKFRENTNS